MVEEAVEKLSQLGVHILEGLIGIGVGHHTGSEGLAEKLTRHYGDYEEFYETLDHLQGLGLIGAKDQHEFKSGYGYGIAVTQSGLKALETYRHKEKAEPALNS